MLPFSDHVYLLEKARIPFERMLCCFLSFFLFFKRSELRLFRLWDETRGYTIFLWRKKLHVRQEHSLAPTLHIFWGWGKGFGRNLQDCYFLWETGWVPPQMAVVFAPLTRGDRRGRLQGMGSVFSVCFVPWAFHLVGAQEIPTE